MSFSVKMDESQLALYKKKQRRENRSKTRQAIFINEYVFTKYFDIYQEGAQMYNEINMLYPRKPDLRRTEEFRVWKDSVTDRPSIRRNPRVKRQPYVFPTHPNIPIAQHVDPNAGFVVMDWSENPQPENPQPETENPQPETENPQPEPENPQPETENPPPEPENPQPETENPPPESPHQLKGKVMVLNIPLMSPPAETQEVPSVITETLQIVTDEVLQEYTVDGIEPSLHEEVSPEIVEKIMEELRQDPGLKDIMTTIEEQIELEQVGLDINIPDEDDRLEIELENMLLW